MDRLLGLFDQPMLINLAMQLFNTAVIVAILAYFVYIPAKAFMKKRADRVREQLEAAQQDYNSAKQAKASYEIAMNNIDNERIEILETARKQALENEAEIISRARDEAEVLKNRAMLDISRERQQANDEMRRQMVEISTVLASRYIQANIDSEAQARMLGEIITELGDATWQN